jgi:alanine racemase
MSPDPARAEIVVDLAAIRHNVRRLREVVATPDTSARKNPHLGTQEPAPRLARTDTSALMMTVVKADGYGHGMLPAARAAREGGADWLGVATLDEALTLRAGGDSGPVLCWLGVPGEDYAEAIELDVDVTAYSLAELEEIEAAARRVGRVARVQFKVDTGLSRGGCAFADWPTLAGAARQAEQAGHVRVTGVWSHFACSDDPGHPANDEQESVFREALVVAADAGLRPEVRHLANSAAAILRPSARFDLVRCGIASYGLDPAPGQAGTADLGLVPAMTVRARLAMVKRIPAGAGVSYGHTWTAEKDTTVALVPAGYGEGVPRVAGNRADVGVGGKRRPIRGVVCMDQFVVDLGDDDAAPGDEVVLFGTGVDGPTATDWAEAVGTINYEIVTRIGGRFTRRIVDSEETPA